MNLLREAFSFAVRRAVFQSVMLFLAVAWNKVLQRKPVLPASVAPPLEKGEV